MSKLETNTIDTVSGTSTLQVGSTNTSTITLGVSGDTVNVPSGVTIANSGTATGFGGANTPMVSVDKTGSSQSISATSWTKVTLNTERVDSDSAFTSNTFTVPSGKAGKYYMSAFATVTSLNGTSDYASLRLANSGNSTIYNGAAVSGNSGYGWFTMAISCIRSLSVGDTVSLWVYGSEAISVNEDNANLTVIKLI